MYQERYMDGYPTSVHMVRPVNRNYHFHIPYIYFILFFILFLLMHQQTQRR
jgi:hypothetical protein